MSYIVGLKNNHRARGDPGTVDKERYSSTERILDMMMYFARAAEGRQSVQAVAQAFGLSRSSTYRYLQMLRERDLIQETAVAGEYEVGPALISLADLARKRVDVARLGEDVIDGLAQATGEAVMLTQRRGDRVTVVAARESTQVVRITVDPARNLPLHLGSPAKVHFAFLPEAEIQRVLNGLSTGPGSRSADDIQRLRADLADIRQKGYSASEGEIEQGVCSISAPVFGPGGNVVAGLSVAGPCFRLNRADRKRVLTLVQAAAEELMLALGAAAPKAMATGRAGE